MVKAVIFDCFGVLVTEAWLPFKAKHFGRDPALYQEASAIAARANRGLISQADFLGGIADLTGLTSNEVAQHIGGNVPNEPLFDYLRELKKDYKIGFLSNIAEDYLRRLFSEEQLGLFDALTLSFKNGHIKPEQRAYEIAAEDLGVKPSESILVDDQPRNVDGARAAGMEAVLYENLDQFKKALQPLLADPKS